MVSLILILIHRLSLFTMVFSWCFGTDGRATGGSNGRRTACGHDSLESLHSPQGHDQMNSEMTVITRPSDVRDYLNEAPIVAACGAPETPDNEPSDSTASIAALPAHAPVPPADPSICSHATAITAAVDHANGAPLAAILDCLPQMVTLIRYAAGCMQD